MSVAPPRLAASFPMITELVAFEVAFAFLPMITFSPPVVPAAPALYPITTLSSADVIVLYAPTPIITFCVAVDNVPVVVSPILILLLKLVPENFTSLKLSNPPEKAKSIVSVSYTHLTLPTSDLV